MDSRTTGKDAGIRNPGFNNPGRELTGPGGAGKQKRPSQVDDLDRVSGGYDPTISGGYSF